MSLINDLLCDLQSRDAAAAADPVLAGLRPVSRRTVTRGPRWLLPLAAMLVATSAFAIFRLDTVPAPVTPLPQDTATAGAVDRASAASEKHHPLATLAEFSLSLGRTPRQDPRPAPSARAALRPTTRLALSTAVARPRRAAADGPPAAARQVAAPVTVRTAAPTPAVTANDLRRDGLAALADGRPGDAETNLRELVARQPGQAQSWLHLVSALTASGKHADAETALIDALAASAEPAPVARELARRMLAREATEEALTLLEAYRPARALDVDHDAFIAAVLQRLGRHDSAAQRYRKVLAVRPEASAWWVGLAISEEARGKSESALDAYRRARNIGSLDARLAAYADQRIHAMLGSTRGAKPGARPRSDAS